MKVTRFASAVRCPTVLPIPGTLRQASSGQIHWPITEAKIISTLSKPASSAQPGRSIAVIGAGIVGAAVALVLTDDGHKVTVIDHCDVGAGTSYGNAGGIVTGAVTPTSTPRVVRSMPSMMFSPDGAAVLRPSHLLPAIPWLLRFIEAGRPSRVATISASLQPLVSRAMAAHQSLAELSHASELIRPVGWLKVYGTAAGFENAALERELMTRHKVNFSVLTADEVADLEPNLDRNLLMCGVFQPDSGFVNFPMALAKAYFERATQAGAQFIRAEVGAIKPIEGGGITLVAGSQSWRFDAVVVAAGAWSKQFAKQIGDHVCLDTERGYHLSFGSSTDHLLRRPVLFPEHQFVLSPMHDGLCLFSGDELAGLKAPPNYERIRALIPIARKVLPGIKGNSVQREWMGFRPSTPDSLPVIGRSPRCRDVFYAFGHGHLGLTLSAITAQAVGAIIGGDPGPFDMTPYQIGRF
jgi:D-amino-acid dehydrogenase